MNEGEPNLLTFKLIIIEYKVTNYTKSNEILLNNTTAKRVYFMESKLIELVLNLKVTYCCIKKDTKQFPFQNQAL